METLTPLPEYGNVGSLKTVTAAFVFLDGEGSPVPATQPVYSLPFPLPLPTPQGQGSH